VKRSTGAKPRGDKREKTRAKLIDAAATIINERGFDRTSLEAVATRAGMTRGAFYNNFQDKEELFLAVSESLWSPIEPKFKKGAPLRAQMRALGEAVVSAAKERRKVAVGAAAFQLYVLTHPEMRQRLTDGNASIYEWAESQLLEYISPDDLPMAPDDFVRTVHALTEGLLTLHFLTPDLITDQTIIKAFKALAGSEP
jgi:AcrR family transcriptional regulator